MDDQGINVEHIGFLVEGLGLTPEDARRGTVELAHLAFVRWRKAADDGLRTTRQDYKAGILPVIETADGASVVLEGELPNMLEHGYKYPEGYDMHDTLLRDSTKSIRYGTERDADGNIIRQWKYLHVPFVRSGSVRGASEGTKTMAPLPYGKKRSASVMRKIRAHVKRLEADDKWRNTTSKPGGGSKWGSSVPEALGGDVLQNKVTGAEHSTGAMTGAYRQQKAYAKDTQFQWISFRTISERTRDGGKWRHPGIRPRELRKPVLEYIRTMIPSVMRQRGQ